MVRLDLSCAGIPLGVTSALALALVRKPFPCASSQPVASSQTAIFQLVRPSTLQIRCWGWRWTTSSI